MVNTNSVVLKQKDVSDKFTKKLFFSRNLGFFRGIFSLVRLFFENFDWNIENHQGQ